MNVRSIASARPQPAPVVHSVHFYDHDEALIQRLGAIVGSTLKSGGAAVLVMTEDHGKQLMNFLEKRVLDVHTAEREGRIFLLDAEATLAKFVVRGKVNGRKFRETVRPILHSASQFSKNATRVTAFGEMVAILWKKGKKEQALQLERFWNDLLQEETFHLHCAYPNDILQHDFEYAHICDHHSMAIGTSAVA